MDAPQPIHPRRNVPPNDTRSQSERVLAEVGPTLELLARVHGWPPPAELIELWCDQLRRAGERLEELQLPVHVAALSDFQVDPAGQLYWVCLPQRIEETRRSLAGENALQHESKDFFLGRLWAHSTPQLIDKLQSQLRRVDIENQGCSASLAASHNVLSLPEEMAPNTDPPQRLELFSGPLVQPRLQQGGSAKWARNAWIVAGALACTSAGILASSLRNGAEQSAASKGGPVQGSSVQGEVVASTDEGSEINTKLETVLGNETEFDLETEFGEGAGIEALLGPVGAFDAVIASVESLPAIDAGNDAFPDMSFPSDGPSEPTDLPEAAGVPKTDDVPSVLTVDESQGVQDRVLEGALEDLVNFRMLLQRPRQRQQHVHKFPSTTKLANLKLEMVQTNQETPLLIDWLVPMQPVTARRSRGVIEIRLAPGDPLALRVQVEMSLQRSLTVETVAAVSLLVPSAASEADSEGLHPPENGWTLAGSEQANMAVAAMDMWLESYPAALATVREQISNTSNGELRSRLRWQRDSLESQAERVKELREQFGRLQQLFTRCEQELLLQIRSGLH